MTTEKPKLHLKWCPLRGNLCMGHGCTLWVPDRETCAIQDLAINLGTLASKVKASR